MEDSLFMSLLRLFDYRLSDILQSDMLTPSTKNFCSETYVIELVFNKFVFFPNEQKKPFYN